MLWLNFGKWSHAAGKYLIADRVYGWGYKWTPIIHLQLRWPGGRPAHERHRQAEPSR